MSRCLANVRAYLIALLVLPLFSFHSTYAQGDSESTDSILNRALEILKHRQGVWDSSWEFLDEEGDVSKVVNGIERGEYVIEGRVLQITTEVPEMGLFSKSLNYFHPLERKLYFFSVDKTGDHWILTEEVGSGVMLSHAHKQSEGADRIIRFKTLRSTATEVDVLSEHSLDNGVTWKPVFHQYLRKRQD